MALFCLIFVLSLIAYGVSSFDPEPRGGHMAVLIDKRLYFMGGSKPIPKNSTFWSPNRQFNLSDEVFYLDLSSPFTIDAPPYMDISSTSQMPFGSEKGTTVKGNNDLRIFLVGGVQQNIQTLAYDVKTQVWGTSGPGTTGPPLPNRRSTATIIDQNGVIYIFGGRVEIDTGSNVFTCFNDMFTFNIDSLVWTNLSLPNSPSPRSHCSATLMPDGKIIYIGGVNQSIPGQPASRIVMNEIYVFDTILSTWSLKAAKIPSFVDIGPRVGHTAVLGKY
ncbi:hypothetical protein C2G38_1600135 [Gigaspora rosea]|uniref:Galactose oxidase n=1 Tax=Gigaspora rosea TaxID=44941 RepID=A0A397V0Q0_9GLOM|nr:hypothetical protein C2G38_1600135 [Gigaspora rosea]